MYNAALLFGVPILQVEDYILKAILFEIPVPPVVKDFSLIFVEKAHLFLAPSLYLNYISHFQTRMDSLIIYPPPHPPHPPPLSLLRFVFYLVALTMIYLLLTLVFCCFVVCCFFLFFFFCFFFCFFFLGGRVFGCLFVFFFVFVKSFFLYFSQSISPSQCKHAKELSLISRDTSQLL